MGTIGLGCKAGARPRTRRVLDKTKRVVGSMAKLEHVQNMNRPLTSVQNMFSICPKRYGMNVPILVYNCWPNLAQNRFTFMAQSDIKVKIYIFCVFSGPDLTHVPVSACSGKYGKTNPRFSGGNALHVSFRLSVVNSCRG